MAHAKATLTPLGRKLFIERIAREGWPMKAAADSMGAGAQTAYTWVRRYASRARPGAPVEHRDPGAVHGSAQMSG